MGIAKVEESARRICLERRAVAQRLEEEVGADRDGGDSGAEQGLDRNECIQFYLYGGR